MYEINEERPQVAAWAHEARVMMHPTTRVPLEESSAILCGYGRWLGDILSPASENAVVAATCSWIRNVREKLNAVDCSLDAQWVGDGSVWIGEVQFDSFEWESLSADAGWLQIVQDREDVDPELRERLALQFGFFAYMYHVLRKRYR